MQKKVARAPAAVEQVEHPRGDRRVRAVVEGEGHLAAARGGGRQPAEVGAEQAALRPEAGAGDQRDVVGEARRRRARASARGRRRAPRRAARVEAGRAGDAAGDGRQRPRGRGLSADRQACAPARSRRSGGGRAGRAGRRGRACRGRCAASRAPGRTLRGTLWAARCARHQATTCLGGEPPRRRRRPPRARLSPAVPGSGTPSTATSSTPASWPSTPSTSRGLTFLPLTLIRSSIRPQRTSSPSAQAARSPAAKTAAAEARVGLGQVAGGDRRRAHGHDPPPGRASVAGLVARSAT